MNELSYVHGASSRPLLGEPIFQNLRRTAQRVKDHEALVSSQQGYRATYGELVDQCEEVARGLMARGVKKGDRVGIWSPNRYEWVIVQYATAAMGAILVNINPAYRTYELEYALNQSGITFLILAAGFRQTDYREMLAEVKGKCPALREAVVLEHGWEALKRDAAKVSREKLHEVERALQFDDPINIQYTSGTTGFPKGATLTHHNILNNGFFIGETLKYSEQDRVCIPVPFYHCFGMVLGNLACTTHGATIVVPAEAFDPILTM
ncbi:MAG TPA: AMP-binding protein, partial [Candidatus Dormibacteraeota bacterium]|nr:AMP-binding protein [Candidatus Dormibacteraeota bacterium]